MRIGDIQFEDKFDSILVALFIFTVLAFTAGCLRIFTRFWYIRDPGIDDTFIVMAVVCSIGYLTSTVEILLYSVRITSDVSYLPNFHQSLYATIIAYTLTHFSVKFSILFQCRRIFVERRARLVFHGLIIYLAIYGVICLLLSIMTCLPVEKYWFESTPGRCVDRMALYYAFAGINIVNDLALLISPIIFIKDLHVPRKTKISLIALFACAGFACIMATTRVHALYDKGKAAKLDQPFKAAFISLWSGLEINIAIICACVPSIRQFILKVIPSLQNSMSNMFNSQRTERFPRKSVQPRSFKTKTRRGQEATDDVEASTGGIKIRVQKAFEMKSNVGMTGDDDSQRYLVTGNHPGWKANCLTEPSDQQARRTGPM